MFNVLVHGFLILYSFHLVFECQMPGSAMNTLFFFPSKGENCFDNMQR